MRAAFLNPGCLGVLVTIQALQARRKLCAIATNEYHRVLEANENPSLWVDLSSQESSAALPGVTSHLLVSIKDDELETEVEESLSTDAEVIRMIKWRMRAL